MALFQLDQVFSYQDANDIKKLWASTTAPTGAGDGEVWLDISTSTYKLKRYKSSTGTWETITGISAAELLTAIKTVDGTTSGLDADLLDGQEGSWYQNAGNLNAGTIPLARIPTTLTGKDADKLDGQEGSYYLDPTNLSTTIPLSKIPTTLTGKSADQLDGQEGSFYQNAGNLTSGTIPSARLSASDLLTLVSTVDGSGSGLDADLYRGKKIQSGSGWSTTAGYQNSFAETFSSTPVVVMIPDENVSVWVGTRTTSQFQAKTSSASAQRIYWIAIG